MRNQPPYPVPADSERQRPAYRLVVLHENQKDWADKVAEKVLKVAREVTQRNGLIVKCSLDEAINDPDSPALVIVLASPEAGISESLADDVERARLASLAVLPVTQDAADYRSQVPESLWAINALQWGNSAEAAHRITGLLGLVEKDRKLFLSYRRVEAEGLALQLRRELADRQFDVFLDRFSVPPGKNFQQRLNEELADKAFVLLLESATAQGSDWVQWEVAYALNHLIPVLALSLPGADPDGKFAVLEDAFRYVVDETELSESMSSDAVLRSDSLASVLDEIETRAARGLRRRRAQLLQSVEVALARANVPRRPIEGWAVLAEPEGRPAMAYLVTPRAPTAADLRQLDDLRLRTGGDDCQGLLVHNNPDREANVTELLEWITTGRPLDTVYLHDLTASLMP